MSGLSLNAKIFPEKSSLVNGFFLCFSKTSSVGKPCSLVSWSVSLCTMKLPIFLLFAMRRGGLEPPMPEGREIYSLLEWPLSDRRDKRIVANLVRKIKEENPSSD